MPASRTEPPPLPGCDEVIGLVIGPAGSSPSTDAGWTAAIDDGPLLDRLLGDHASVAFAVTADLLVLERRNEPTFDDVDQLAKLATGHRTASKPHLVVERVLEPELCRAIVKASLDHRLDRSPTTGADGTVGTHANRKVRHDLRADDAAEVHAAITERIGRRVLPAAHRWLGSRPTGFERPKVVVYESEDGGWFGPHRDVVDRTTHRRLLAVTIEIDPDAYRGDGLRFVATDASPTLSGGDAIAFSPHELHRVGPIRHGPRATVVSFLTAD